MKRIAFGLLAVCLPVAALAAQNAPPAPISADKADSPPANANKDAPAPAAQSATHAAMGHRPAPACAEAKVDCAMTAVPAFAKDGRLWVAFSVGKTRLRRGVFGQWQGIFRADGDRHGRRRRDRRAWRRPPENRGAQ